VGRNIEVETLDWAWHVIRSTTLMAAIAIAGAFPSIASGAVTKSGSAAHAEAPPATIVARGDRLMESRRRVRSGDPLLMPAYRQLIKSADSALQIAPVSVMQKSKVPPSGDKHDFMSLAPYWWPDSSKANGLPYIRRDGVINPESRLDHDGLRFQAMGDAVNALAMAYYFTGDEKYAAKAATLLRVFFIDPATRMNPNLNFAQAVPGVTPGRGTGLIDTRNIPELVDAIRLLRPSRSLRASEYDALVKWSADYLTWLRTSKNGKDERAADNNHGTWYDAQAAALALFVGDTSFARQVIGTDARARIAAHISPNGSQPRELARTRPIHYSLFNLDPYTQLAEMGRLVGTDLWNFTAPNGGSLRAALYFIAPYTDSTLKWSTPEATPLTAEDFATPLLRAASSLRDARLARALARLDESVRASRERLLYPDLPTSNTSEGDAADKATIRFAEQRLENSATRLDPANGYPRATKSDGTWEQRPANAWTSGFFAGTLWYVYELTREDKWKRLAERWTTELEPDKTLRTTHDLGFMIFDSFGHAYLLTGDAHDSAVVIEAARNLATRFNARVGAIKSWDTDSVTDARRGWKYPVIIDNMMNLPLLFWGASHGGDTPWRQMAISHAIRTAEAQLRRDGSTAHVALFDPATGKLLRTTTWQGYSDSSVWARGQAWAIHGFASAYGSTQRPELLRAAQRSADFFLANLPADGVPPWDFRIPDRKHAERDASAAAIAASGLLDLARWAPEPARSRYANAADHIIAGLEKNYLSTDRRGDAILQHSVGGLPQKSEVDVGLVYADYYFLEALVRRRGVFLE
jgi:unsaturated chondroitin disaccharide hydrolase